MSRATAHKNFHNITAGLFALILLLHVLRLTYSWPARIGSWNVPLWLSWMAAILAGTLAFYAWNSKP